VGAISIIFAPFIILFLTFFPYKKHYLVFLTITRFMFKRRPKERLNVYMQVPQNSKKY
jgi:hypothetical protein